MSEDATYDMIRAGKKVRCLMVPFGEPRELGQIRTVEDLNRKGGDVVQGLKEATADAERRVAALERERHGGGQDLPIFYDETVSRKVRRV
jgi:hypothetical protein